MSARILTVEFLTQVGPIIIVVVYAPDQQDSTEVKEQFYQDLNCILSRGNRQVMVMGDLNESVRGCMD